MRRLLYATVLLGLCAVMATAAEPYDQWVGAFVSWNQYAAPQVNGGLAYAKRVRGESHPTYSYSAVTFLSVQRAPFRVATSTETGVAQYVTKFWRFSTYAIATAGISVSGSESGTETGPSAGAGYLAQAGFRSGFTVGPMVRIWKSSLAETQWAVGLVIGWGER